MLKNGKRKNLSVWGVLLVLVCFISFSAVPSYSADIDEINRVIRERGLNWVAGDTPLSNLTLEEMRKLTGAMEEPDTGMAADPPRAMGESVAEIGRSPQVSSAPDPLCCLMRVTRRLRRFLVRSMPGAARARDAGPRPRKPHRFQRSANCLPRNFGSPPPTGSGAPAPGRRPRPRAIRQTREAGRFLL